MLNVTHVHIDAYSVTFYTAAGIIDNYSHVYIITCYQPFPLTNSIISAVLFLHYHFVLTNSFNSQLANVLIKSADNRTRRHDFKVALWMPQNITLQIG